MMSLQDETMRERIDSRVPIAAAPGVGARNAPAAAKLSQVMQDPSNGIASIAHERPAWHRLGVAVGLTIVAVSVVVLYRLLRDIEPEKVIDALRAEPLPDILLAWLFVAAGYVSLTLYDFFALRTIGRRNVPYRIAALASFTSYTIGHNLGATVLTGGAVRLRIYSAWGLGIVDVVKIAFVTGLTFWLGNTFLLGAGMAYAPVAASAVNQLPPAINRIVGLAGLFVIAVYLIWLLPRPRAIGRSDWRIELPSAPLTFVQIGIGILDLTFGALAMYTLLPAHPPIDFIPLLVIFVTATLLGFLSHAPGSLGILEAAMLVGLSEFPKEQLLASLLIFRVLYFVLPLCLAAVTLTLREIWLAWRQRG
jgi:glycosyltransferase 2 family protein